MKLYYLVAFAAYLILANAAKDNIEAFERLTSKVKKCGDVDMQLGNVMKVVRKNCQKEAKQGMACLQACMVIHIGILDKNYRPFKTEEEYYEAMMKNDVFPERLARKVAAGLAKVDCGDKFPKKDKLNCRDVIPGKICIEKHMVKVCAAGKTWDVKSNK